LSELFIIGDLLCRLAHFWYTGTSWNGTWIGTYRSIITTSVGMRLHLCDLVGELAPLLSALGHEMHKRHKSAGVFWPDLDAVLLCSVSFSLLPLNLL
jgi:hypothetical protein